LSSDFRTIESIKYDVIFASVSRSNLISPWWNATRATYTLTTRQPHPRPSLHRAHVLYTRCGTALGSFGSWNRALRVHAIGVAIRGRKRGASHRGVAAHALNSIVIYARDAVRSSELRTDVRARPAVWLTRVFFRGEGPNHRRRRWFARGDVARNVSVHCHRGITRSSSFATGSVLRIYYTIYGYCYRRPIIAMEYQYSCYVQPITMIGAHMCVHFVRVWSDQNQQQQQPYRFGIHSIRQGTKSTANAQR
jgi:hypothetical protein